MGYDFDELDIALIPCQGKNKIIKLASIFKALDVPLYSVWDSDRKTVEGNSDKAVDNHTLLRFNGATAEDHACTVEDTYACFEDDLETCMKREVGEAMYADLLDEGREKYGYEKHSQVRKNAEALEHIVKEAMDRGGRFTKLESIVERIVSRANKHSPQAEA